MPPTPPPQSPKGSTVAPGPADEEGEEESSGDDEDEQYDGLGSSSSNAMTADEDAFDITGEQEQGSSGGSSMARVMAVADEVTYEIHGLQ